MSFTLKDKNVLIVDDERDVYFTIKSILEDSGFKVAAFNDAVLTLDSYLTNFYDLIILDINMPKMDELSYILN